ncbi:NAD(P)/FAD-dependent oxidoreductase [Neorhizobium tomejilense]|uniref:NAD(P)/FAD-dependent oxidoreductase n=1 Tax=Neorhizobium tomejilense TaxID=2093828 RepID=UPI003ED1426B
METVIIGNGIIALTTAFRLAKRADARDLITIIGPSARAGSATRAAGAMLNSFAEIEKGSLDHEIDMFRFELSHLAGRMWPRFENEMIEAGASCLPLGCRKCSGFGGGGCVDTGTYVVNNTAADDLDDENYDAIVNALEQFDEPFRHVSPRDIPNYLPEQKARATRALYIENEGWFNPKLILEKLDNLLKRFPQVRFVDAEAQRLLKTAEVLTGVVLSNGETLVGDTYLLATGATVTDLIEKSDLGIDIQRIFYGVGVSLEIRSRDFPHTKAIRTPNRGLACGIYSVPFFRDPDEPQDHILIGATNFISPTPYNYGRLTSVETLMKAAMEQINVNFYKADLVGINVGWRPTSQDGYPLIGRTSISNLVVCTGTKRDGFHLSPLLSEILANIIHGDKTDERIEWFHPERKPLRILSREAAIEKSIKHIMSAAYQHGFTPSPGGLTRQIVESHKANLERLHDDVGAHDWGIPPDMLDMYRYGHAKTELRQNK